MNTFKLKTYKMKPDTSLPEHHFFILSKGYNAGKPLVKPCPNCFILWADTQEEKGKLFWICYALWKSGTFYRSMVGSVIVFLRIADVAFEIERASTLVASDIEKFDQLVIKLQELTRLEKLLTFQLKLIGELKSTLSYKAVNTRDQ